MRARIHTAVALEMIMGKVHGAMSFSLLLLVTVAYGKVPTDKLTSDKIDGERRAAPLLGWVTLPPNLLCCKAASSLHCSSSSCVWRAMCERPGTFSAYVISRDRWVCDV